MVPHISEELWQILNNEKMLCHEPWPLVDKTFLQKKIIEIPVQINGKMRALVNVPVNTNKIDLENIALKNKNILKFLNAKPKKVIIVPNRVINFVV